MAQDIEAHISLPLIHIADATAEKIVAQGIQKIALLGTWFTMREDFYKGRLRKKYNLEVIIPSEEEMKEVHRIIYDELCKGEIYNQSRDIYKQVIQGLRDKWAEGVILWCTEITMLISQGDSVLPVFDTTEIHAQACVDFALNS